jgi:hypothetical protein
LAKTLRWRKATPIIAPDLPRWTDMPKRVAAIGRSASARYP